MLASAEGRIGHVDERVHELQFECASLHDQLQAALANLGALEAEHGALKDEYRAMAEDMEAIVRENQAR